MRVVIDTNVFVAAGFKRGGYSARLLERIREGEWQLVWNQRTRRETERIVRKIPVLRNSVLDGLFRAEDELRGKLSEAEFSFIADSEDRKFAALAVAANVPLITNDDHLLAWKERLTVPVMSPRELFEEQV